MCIRGGNGTTERTFSFIAPALNRNIITALVVNMMKCNFRMVVAGHAFMVEKKPI